MKKNQLEDYLPFIEAVEYSGLSKSGFMYYVTKNRIETIKPYRYGSLYKRTDIDKIKKSGIDTVEQK